MYRVSLTMLSNAYWIATGKTKHILTFTNTTANSDSTNNSSTNNSGSTVDGVVYSYTPVQVNLMCISLNSGKGHNSDPLPHVLVEYYIDTETRRLLPTTNTTIGSGVYNTNNNNIAMKSCIVNIIQ